MIQVENEIGVLGSIRDFSEIANNAFNGQVPSELIRYLEKNKSVYIRPFLKYGLTMVISKREHGKKFLEKVLNMMEMNGKRIFLIILRKFSWPGITLDMLVKLQRKGKRNILFQCMPMPGLNNHTPKIPDSSHRRAITRGN